MKTYHKIHNVYKRDGKDILHGVYSQPEFEYLAYNEWEFTEKVDGTNIRVMWKDGEMKTYRVERRRTIIEERYVKATSLEIAQLAAELVDDWNVCEDEEEETIVTETRREL